ncbi:MAG: histidine phosphatase family protein [Eubacterium sp.]|nr:histidine phosphatase family protein [Eubacterium sp.]
MEIWIVRHADPDYAHDSITEKGRREAALVGKRLAETEFAAVYCSPLGRAQDTAAYYLAETGKSAITLDWLQEFRGTVDWMGEKQICWDRLPAYWTAVDAYYDHDRWLEVPLMKNGDVERHYRQVCQGVDALIADHGYVHDGRLYRAERPNADKLLLFCHFGVEAALLSHVFSISPMILWHNFVALPTSVTRLASVEREQGKAIFNCIQFGDLSHLYAGGEGPSFQARFCEQYTDDTRH